MLKIYDKIWSAREIEMKRKKSIFKYKEIYLGENGYIFFILLFSFLKGIGLSILNQMYWIASVFGLIIFVFALLQEKCSLIETQKIVGILLVSAIVFYCSKGLGTLLLGILIVSLKNIEADDCFRLIEPIWILSIIACVGLSFVGITSNNVVEQARLVGGIKVRNTLGYAHPNLFSLVVVIGIMLYCYNKKITFHKMLILILINSLVYLLTYSSTGAIIGMLAAIGVMLIDNINIRFNNKIIYHLVSLCCFLPMIISFISAWVYREENHFLFSLNVLLTGRILGSNLYLTNYPLTLFGQPFNKELGGFLDNAYCYILLRYGLIVFLFFVIMYILIIRDCIEEGSIRRLYFCFLFLLYGFIEAFFQNCFMNYSLFFFGDIIWRKNIAGRGATIYEAR